MQKKLGMIVHGFNLGEFEWNRIEWGEPPYRLGRIPKAVQLMMDEYPQVEKILFGSGASERHGMKEGAYIIQYLNAEWHRLREFEAFKGVSKYEMDRLKERFMRRAAPEIKSHNTFSELEHGIPRLFDLGCRRVVLITEPTHISRAMAHGFEVLSTHPWGSMMSLVGEHSDVNPAKVQPSEVVVFEPRGDGQNEIVPNLRRIFRIPTKRRAEFNEKLDQALTSVGV